jgi:hypothetical protein
MDRAFGRFPLVGNATTYSCARPDAAENRRAATLPTGRLRQAPESRDAQTKTPSPGPVTASIARGFPFDYLSFVSL